MRLCNNTKDFPSHRWTVLFVTSGVARRGRGSAEVRRGARLCGHEVEIVRRPTLNTDLKFDAVQELNRQQATSGQWPTGSCSGLVGIHDTGTV